MKVIGLTGGIGSGKSTVARFLGKMGAVVIDADKVGHEAFMPGTELHRQVVKEFGAGVLGEDGGIDRQKLGGVVFGNEAARQKLNGIMHPAMYRMVEEKLAALGREETAVVVLEAPLLIEAGWTKLADEVWVTVAPEKVILKRLEGRSGLSASASRARIRAQLAADERASHATGVIDTDCSLEELEEKVRGLWRERLGVPPSAAV